jgi:large subunit ribosomal protein L25
MGGVLEQALFTLPIEALPRDIPVAIEADVSALNIGDQFRVSELALPAGVVTHVEGEELVAQVVAPRVAEEEVPEGEEGAEGAEAAAEGEGAGEAAASAGGGEGESGE